MKREETRNIFNYVKEMLVSYKVETIENGTNYILDFENGTSFSVDDVESMFVDYCLDINHDDCDNFEDYTLKHAIEVGKAQTYHINYCTGVEQYLYVCDLDVAKKIADDGACYTQRNIIIVDGLTKKAVASRTWWGCMDGLEEYEEEYDADNCIRFGDWGYYGAWEDVYDY